MYLRGIVVGLILASALLNAADNWGSRASLGRGLPESGTPAAWWRGGDAAFLAVIVGAGDRVHSIVRLDGGRTQIRFDGSVHTSARAERVTSLDLEGVRTADAVVLFHTERHMARTALSFDTGTGREKLRYIVTGLAPGMWEIWRDGWVVDIGIPVRAGEGVLYFEDRPGSFFIRRLN